MEKIYIGTSGYNYADWKLRFYPTTLAKKDWLSFYGQQFTTVEINATFYGSFPTSVYKKWADQTPKDFRFVIKGSRYVTHVKRLKELTDEVDKQIDAAASLGEKLAVILWQFPKNFKKTEENETRFRSFIERLPKETKQAIELRDSSWFTPDIYELLKKSNTAIVINETRAFPVITEVVGSFVYIRFHGPTALYASSYSEAQLHEWAQRIKEWGRSKQIYAYFNNDVSGYAIQNAKRLEELVSS